MRFPVNTVTILIILLLSGTLLAQDPLADPRSLALGGATVSTAEGIHAVGHNPARLALSEKDLSINLFGFTFGLTNNLLSVNNYNLVNGADFIDPIASDYVDKDKFLDDMPDDGFRFNTDFHLPMPGLNWARGTTAYTSDIVVYGDMGLPKALMELMLEGNTIDQELDLSLEEEIIGAAEWGFSLAMPTGNFAFGITLKYLQGLFYLGVDPDSSWGTFNTKIEGLQGSGRYLFRQAVGGSGFGLDLGFATGDIQGFQFGISLINAMGAIRWHGPSLTKDLMGDMVLGLMPWRENEYFLYTFEANDVTMEGFQGVPLDSLFNKESYTVFESADSGLVRSEGRDLSSVNPKSFVTDYPAIFRMGGSRIIPEVGRVSVDLSTSFQDRLWASRGWVLGLGIELLAPPTFPIRMGLRYGGRDNKQLAVGFGVHKGFLQYDMALALNNGFWLHTAKGLSLSMGLTFVR